MRTFLLLLHVLSAILIIGPLAVVPFYGLRSLRVHDHDAVLQAARWTGRFALGSLLTAALGGTVVAATAKETYDFGTPWVVISLTLYLVMLLVALFWARPALRSGMKLLETGTPEPPVMPETPEGEEPPHEALAAAGAFLTTKGKIDNAVGRVGAAAGVTLLLICLIVVLMVTRPFGN
ncbi:DUF2269 family protein [Longispora sp. NPDC051575]|uniref:DUF2269 family protein n=1 Tax=Longispora sp. NPDC051575 TaxID=3154943 RepID=UPI00344A7C40